MNVNFSRSLYKVNGTIKEIIRRRKRNLTISTTSIQLLLNKQTQKDKAQKV